MTSYEILRHGSGAQDYERMVVEGCGHLDCWMGTEACADVNPIGRKECDGCAERRSGADRTLLNRGGVTDLSDL